MLALVLCLLALGMAPVLDVPLRRFAGVGTALDSLSAVLIAGIVVGEVVPYGVAALGWPALLVAAAGAAVPIGCGWLPDGHSLIRVLAAVALFVHGALDGAGLAASNAGHGLAAAVVLHTIPLALAVWRGVAPHRGAWAAGALLAGSGAGTIAGYHFAAAVLGPASGALAVAQCLVAGSLLHVIAHSTGGAARPSGIGAMLGAAAVIALMLVEPDGEASPLSAAAGLLKVVAPAGVLGYALIPLFSASAPRAWARATAALGGDLAPLALLPTFSALGPGLALARLVAGAAGPGDAPPTGTAIERLRYRIDDTAASAVAGVAIAAAIAPVADLSGLPPYANVPLLAVAGAVLRLGPVGCTPLAVALHQCGASAGSALALAIAGSCAEPRDARSLASNIGTAAIIGWIVDVSWPDYVARPLATPPDAVWIGAALILGAAYGESLLRRGLAEFLEPWLGQHAEH